MTSVSPGAAALDPTIPGSWWDRWPNWELRLVEPADARAVLIAVAVGAAFDLGVRSGVATLAGALGFALAAVGLVLSGRLETRAARMCAGGAALLGAFLMLRTSPWLVPLDVLGAVGLLTLAAMLARSGSVGDLSAALLASRAVLAIVHALGSLGFLLDPPLRWLHRGRTAHRQQTSVVLRGVLMATPVVVVLWLLLASADRIFASLVSIDFELTPSVAAHVVLVTVGTVGFAGLLRVASARPSEPMPSVSWRLSSVEWTILFGSVATLLGVFAGVQAFAMGGGGRAVLETEGLTYAEYARSGYFQLLAVTVLVGALLGVVGPWCDRTTPAQRRRFAALALGTLALTAVVLVVALHRLRLYEDAYGWTMLRLMAKAMAVWIAIVLLLLGARVAGAARGRAWFVPASAGAGLAVLIVLNLANPEAMVVRHNVDRSGSGAEEVDAPYLTGLSDDAIPALVDSIDRWPEASRDGIVASLCLAHRARSADSEPPGALAWNRAAADATAALRTVCARAG